MTKDWHFNIKHKNKIKVLLKVSSVVHSWSKLVWLTFQFSYSVGCFIRWLSVSRNFTNGKLWFRISPFLEFELAESLIICSLYLTKSVSDSRVCQERSETQISMRRGMRCDVVSSVICETQWGRGVVGKLDTCTLGWNMEPYSIELVHPMLVYHNPWPSTLYSRLPYSLLSCVTLLHPK